MNEPEHSVARTNLIERLNSWWPDAAHTCPACGVLVLTGERIKHSDWHLRQFDQSAPPAPKETT